MNTKKLLALITVICLLVCVAIPVAAAPGDRVYPEYNEELMGYELVCDGSTKSGAYGTSTLALNSLEVLYRHERPDSNVNAWLFSNGMMSGSLSA